MLKNWKHQKEMEIRKNILLDEQRARFEAFCENEGIWYMPLKGVILKELYPYVGMRQMADNDILYDENYKAKIRQYFLGQGYKVISYGQGNHDVYQKQPVYNFEMHGSLNDIKSSDLWCGCYEHVKIV